MRKIYSTCCICLAQAVDTAPRAVCFPSSQRELLGTPSTCGLTSLSSLRCVKDYCTHTSKLGVRLVPFGV